MISIIISSYKEEYFLNFLKNVEDTCGQEYEIIKIENKNKFSLCHAYNIGGEKAKYPYLVFIHEDTRIHTNNWGGKIIELLNIPSTGILGLSGSNYYPNFPGSWWNCQPIITHLIQQHSDGTSTEYLRKNFHENTNKMPVKALDGVFMTCTKDVFSEFKFDERIDGYHCYDLIFSLNVSSKYQNYVIDEILIEHFSNGSLDNNWIKNILKVKNIIGNLENQNLITAFEMDAIYSLILTMNRCKLNKSMAVKIILKNLSIKHIGLKNYLKAINRLRYI